MRVGHRQAYIPNPVRRLFNGVFYYSTVLRCAFIYFLFVYHTSLIKVFLMSDDAVVVCLFV